MVKYLYKDIFVKEIPDEISLGFIITGCNIQCKDCHSKHIWDKELGYPLNNDIVLKALDKQQYASCLLFFGGEDREELKNIIRYTKENNKNKVALYSGMDLPYFIEKDKDWISILDYLKVGEYNSTDGPLSLPTTNQKLYKIENKILEDITHKFWRNNG